ncbi:uncharacterized protein LOC131167966 [Malania oleifera]|uniref:uncharacterized protein LOC131167966 n=1 Tax=Malania oleifera TaxID=397392 RepID=UPI0025ADB9D3|nr:uncharacterized protein LOC131167966 [Malania oleifera]XP_057983055.1 uncharacterized protein LOC131167966 [Malania oleifera]XP_057983056.1 uncharacterized protein LOC131167966 [Malania oleifera]
MAAPARAFIFSRIADLSLRPLRLSPPQPPLPPISRHLVFKPLLPPGGKRPHFSGGCGGGGGGVVSCLVSGVDGGGVSDDFVSTRKAGFEKEFSVIAAMLKRIEPLDTSLISKGVSDSAKDSMKQTISTMLGLLPSDQFSVTVRVSKHPLDRLLVSSVITGYTLWNAEYRISLMRNFDISPYSSERSDCTEQREVSEAECEESQGNDGEVHVGVDGDDDDLDERNPQSLGDLPLEAWDYIQQLQFELLTVKKELSVQKQEYRQMENNREKNNNLLEYLRSLEPDMVTELSQPSAMEVEGIIHELVQNILQRFFKDDTSTGITENYQNDDDGTCDAITTSRDYLAKLLFWCMLLGHHLRGLENRLHLSFVGLL